ncbi:hypothetical protein ACWDE9_45415, partial [Streptomyces olivaceoviridis]
RPAVLGGMIAVVVGGAGFGVYALYDGGAAADTRTARSAPTRTARSAPARPRDKPPHTGAPPQASAP